MADVGSSVLPCNDEQDAADSQVGQQDVDPDVWRHGVEEGEEAVVGVVGLAVQDADAHVEERLGEIHHFLPQIGDGKWGHGQVGFLEGEGEDIAHVTTQAQLSCKATAFLGPVSSGLSDKFTQLQGETCSRPTL